MKRRTWFQKKIFWLFLILILFFAIISITIFEIKFKDSFYPGVFVDGKPVGGKTFSDVLGYYKKGADALSRDGISLIIESEKGEQRVNIPMTASGMSSDRVVEYFSLGAWEETLKKAFDYGRNGSVFKQAKEQTLLLLKNKIFDFPATFQSGAIESFYDREMKGYFKETAPAQFIYSKNKVIIQKEMSGEEIDFKEVTLEIDKKLSSFDPSPVQIKAKIINPEITTEKLTPYLGIAKEISRSINLSFKYQNYKWNVIGKKFITWLKLDDNNRLIVDGKKLESFLDKNIIPVLDNPSQSSRFEMKDGVLMESVSGKSGNIVDVEKTVSKVEETVFGTRKSIGLADSFLASLDNLGTNEAIIEDGFIVIPIVIKEATPRVTKDTISQYEIKELVGTAITNFKGSSADRIHNIEIGVSKLSGILIAPGEEFSTINSLGPTTEEEGFVKEFVIKENRSVKELGGGLCQVATTLFRLALDTGLKITERTNHRYVVSYYGPGLDATIYEPHPDLRFVNDTGHYLLLQGKVENNQLTFEFYGQKDGRQITISKPILSNEKPAPGIKYLMSEEVKYATMECSETPRKGLTAEVTYTVRYKDGKSNEQKFKSIYQPWGKICLIGLSTATSTLPKN